MGRIFGYLGGAFWGGVAAIIGLAVVVTVLRLARQHLPVTAGVANEVGKVTGLNV